NVALFRAANAVLLGMFAALTVGHVGRRLFGRPWVAVLLVVLAATAIPLMTVTTVLFAEPLFLALAAAPCLAGASASRPEGRRAPVLAIVAGLFAGLAALTRSIGIAVALGVTIALLTRRRVRDAALAGAAAAVLVAPWSFWVTAHHAETDPALLSNYGT